MSNISYTSSIPNSDDYVRLFDTTGWNNSYQASAEELITSITHSWKRVCAYEGEHLVGFGRVVSDGVLYGIIYDLIVLPEYQGKGIGDEILRKLVDACQSAGLRSIQLFSAQGKCEFYKKRGFSPRPNDAPGMIYSEE